MDMMINGGASAVFHGMGEEDVNRIMQYPFNMFASDASIRVLNAGMPHPRGYGTNARVLGKYVREEKVISLEEAMRRMTSLPAQKFQLNDRGLLREGYAADIVIFNEKEVKDVSTYEKPHAYSKGFYYVIVNGMMTVDNEKHLGIRAEKHYTGPVNNFSCRIRLYNKYNQQTIMRRLLFMLCLFPSFVFAQQRTVIFLDSLLKQQAERGFSGVLLVAEKGKPIYHQAVGFREFAPKEPLKKTDIFELASVSKQFTAMIIMKLKEKKLLDYDDPIEKYLSIPYKNITLRHLLTHTSGLPDYQSVMDKYWDKTKVAGNEDAIAYLVKYVPPVAVFPGNKIHLQ